MIEENYIKELMMNLNDCVQEFNILNGYIFGDIINHHLTENDHLIVSVDLKHYPGIYVTHSIKVTQTTIERTYIRMMDGLFWGLVNRYEEISKVSKHYKLMPA